MYYFAKEEIKMKKRDGNIPAMLGFSDIFAYIFVTLVALFLLFSVNGRAEPERAVVSVGNTVTEYAPSENKTVELENNGIKLTVVIENGSVYVKSADCHDRICVQTGKISKTGQVIVCAPAMVAIRIESETEGGYDAIIR